VFDGHGAVVIFVVCGARCVVVRCGLILSSGKWKH
jgi:hypothetical protein